MFGLDDERLARLIYLLLLVAFLGTGLFSFRNRMSKALRDIAIWVGVFVLLLIGYTYRAPLMSLARPVLSEINPSRPMEITDRSGTKNLVLSRSSNGHFQVSADLDGTSVTFLVDTGASRSVLTYRDAERVGLAPETLRYNLPINTANGRAYEAAARIGRMDIGPFAIEDMRIGVVPEDQLNVSLLGLDVLDRFASWRVEGDRLFIVPEL
jgi:aspartyl protease family protein